MLKRLVSVSATLPTVLVLPTLYHLVEERAARRAARS